MRDRTWPRTAFFPLALASLVVAGALALNLARPPYNPQGAQLAEAGRLASKAKEAYGQNNWPLARDYASQALALTPSHLTARLLLGLALMNMNALDQAEAEFRQVLAVAGEARDSSAWAHNNLGVVFQRRGQFKLAAQEYQSALEADPYNSQARANLAAVKIYLQ